MTGQTKKRKLPGQTRDVLAENINRLMEHRYRESPNKPMSLAEEAGVSLSSVQRTLSRETGASIDTVEAFAKVFRVPTFQLLVPWQALGELAVTERRREPMVRGRLGTNHRINKMERRRRNME